MRATVIVVSLLALLGACGKKAEEAPAPAAPAPAMHDMAAISARVGDIILSDAWAPPTPNGVTTAAGYVSISNTGAADDALVAVSSPAASSVSVHEMKMDGNMMTMRPVASLAVPAGGNVALAPEGMHLMFEGITQPFVDGASVPVTLKFEHAGEVTLQLNVHARGTTPADHAMQ